ncbi:hypothetical protein A2625_04910 [candidate division WOR-1 bacterium RIFCSPHIGHO2_01_FULL_53_15]|uniref:Uncharacterized protein n=1 Tax=candidate division WOR-1 bacterium RIFCSPHIGHO2_01_FULL_53_15 TaxID=1802564 RepID=A0A1F4Q4E9_UNCSA|nr:MAG: hypothetical protein A2625_04910 [candidate division WOR-1 bacterium RIFCSPHIGHO2_01_FULL_53_15]OGC13219.1 MAG: hypothetical protein A3D23_01165 [candidate division WOR-1 bacterium RIFCSPHIGHO2_02_FULL_53_26]
MTDNISNINLVKSFINYQSRLATSPESSVGKKAGAYVTLASTFALAIIAAPFSIAGCAPEPDDDAQFYYSEGRVLAENGHIRESIAVFEHFISEYPDSPLANDAQYRIGMSYYLLNEYEAAISASQALIDKYPDSPLADDAQYMIGMSYYLLNEYETAISIFQTFIDRSRPGSAVDEARYKISYCYLLLGDSYLDSNEYEKAAEAYQKAIDNDPDSHLAQTAKDRLAAMDGGR